jgi:carboxypeptidase Taq
MVAMSADKSNEVLRLLEDRLATISDVNSARKALNWDRHTYMPEGAVAARAEQLATLSRLVHEMLVSEETGELLFGALEKLEPGSESSDLVRRAKREYERAVKLPNRLVEELARATALAQPAWERARARSEWASFESHLQKILPLQQETAECLGYEDHPYDALLDLYEPGAKKARLQKIFEELKAELVPLIREICALSDGDRSPPLYGRFDEEKQEGFVRKVVSDFGYDWKRGRLDRVAHPFCVSLGGPGDVRITTRFDPGWLSPALFATLTKQVTPCTSRASTLPTPVLPSPAVPRWACTSPNRGCGRTWSAAPGRSGPSTTPDCTRPSLRLSEILTSKPSTAQ